MDDLIYRQDAIDALAEEVRYVDGYYVEYDAVISETDAMDAIKALPSAQPEVIRCNDCKHWTQSMGKMKGYGLGKCDFHDVHLVTCNGFCYWAERRDNG